MSVMEISRDTAGLQECAVMFFDHAAKLVSAGERFAGMVTPPEFSPAHLAWVKYLLQVEKAIGKCPAAGETLPADVVEGLATIEAAREQFKRKHKQCGSCGRWAPLYAKRCMCSKEM